VLNKVQAMTKEEFWATVTPALLSFLSVAVPAILSYIAYIVQSWVAKAREAKDREALHSAIKSGTNAAEKQLGDAGTTSEKIAYALDYARESVPDAMRNLKPSQEVLVNLAQAKIEEKTPCPPSSLVSP
jgi:hypothetical protein